MGDSGSVCVWKRGCCWEMTGVCVCVCECVCEIVAGVRGGRDRNCLSVVRKWSAKIFEETKIKILLLGSGGIVAAVVGGGRWKLMCG